METATFDLPAMYGDHHVIEVRRILLEMEGVAEVYASSAFHVVEITFDPSQVSADALEARLEEAGYLGELDVPTETGTPATEAVENGDRSAFRQSAAYAAAGSNVSFAHEVPFTGRPLWPCPGMGTIPVPTAVLDEEDA
jgi:copper chaperone CopZ